MSATVLVLFLTFFSTDDSAVSSGAVCWNGAYDEVDCSYAQASHDPAGED